MDYDILAGIIPTFDVYNNRSDNYVIIVWFLNGLRIRYCRFLQQIYLSWYLHTHKNLTETHIWLLELRNKIQALKRG